MWLNLAHLKNISEFKCSGRLFPVLLMSENAIFCSCCLVQGEHALQRGVLPGQHGHVLDQSGREGKTGGAGRRAGSSESTESTLPPLLTQLPTIRFLRLLLSGVRVGNAALVYRCGPHVQH